MTLQFVRRHVERSFACVWRAPGMRSVSDLRPLHRYTHAYAHLADLHTYAGVPCGAGDRRWDCVISRGGGTASRNDPFPTIQRCSFRCFCTRKGLRVAVEMRDARRRCDFAMADLYRVMLSHGWRQCVGRMYTWCGDARDRCGNGWKKKKGNKNRWSIDRYFWYRYAREEINKEKNIYIYYSILNKFRIRLRVVTCRIGKFERIISRCKFLQWWSRMILLCYRCENLYSTFGFSLVTRL